MAQIYSNCLWEALKAKMKKPTVQILYFPAIFNEVCCPHIMWKDENAEHEFWTSAKLHWWQYLCHKGEIRIHKTGYYKRCIARMIDFKYY